MLMPKSSLIVNVMERRAGVPRPAKTEADRDVAYQTRCRDFPSTHLFPIENPPFLLHTPLIPSTPWPSNPMCETEDFRPSA